MKASTAVNLILSEIVVKGADASVEADEAQDVIENMNMYMAALDAKGINLGYTSVSDLGDDITIPDGALMGMIANVAVMVAPMFGATATQELIAKARNGLSAMAHLGVSMDETAYPSTLPQGSGNDIGTYTDTHFYPDQEATILGEGGQSIGLESTTT